MQFFTLEGDDVVAYSHGRRITLDTLSPHVIHRRLLRQHWRRPIADLAANVRMVAAALPLGLAYDAAMKVNLLTGHAERDSRDPTGKLLVRYRIANDS